MDDAVGSSPSMSGPLVARMRQREDCGAEMRRFGGAAMTSAYYYEIRVAGMLPPEVLLDFEWLSAGVAPVETVLHGPLPDQAALAAFLARLEDFGADVIEIRRLRENDPARLLVRSDPGRRVFLPAQPHELDSGRFEPRQQSMQGGLIRKRAAHHGLGWPLRGELLESAQRTGGDETRDPDLVIDGHHANPEFRVDPP